MNVHRNSDLAQLSRTVGEVVSQTLADLGVTTAFGVISIHNMPILDAIARQGRIRFVPARGEAGAMSMADAYARVSQSLGVVITSTGTAAANAAGSQVEALSAGSPVLHITAQVDRVFMDRDRAAIHDVPRQPDMLRAISKQYLRLWEPRSASSLTIAAARLALSAPTGPVTLEIPVDVQRVAVAPCENVPRLRLTSIDPDSAAVERLAEYVMNARRPLLWLGGGARHAQDQATELVERGFGAVTSTNGRAIVPENHPNSLGAFNMTFEAQKIYDRSDLIVVVGSRLRGNETRNNEMRLPRPLIQIDVDPLQAGRNYPEDLFIHGDSRATLGRLLQLLPSKLTIDESFLRDISRARHRSEDALRKALGPYQTIADTLSDRVYRHGLPWVRDVTISNSTFGNRYVRIAHPRLGVHALGGGIGQGIAMGIGAACAAPHVKTLALLGDGGAQLMLGELATAVECKANLTYVLMNDTGYGVIRNIQDAQYDGRRTYSTLLTPSFELICASIGLPYQKISSNDEFASVLDDHCSRPGPSMIEVDMTKIGPFPESFAGPPAGAAGGGS